MKSIKKGSANGHAVDAFLSPFIVRQSMCQYFLHFTQSIFHDDIDLLHGHFVLSLCELSNFGGATSLSTTIVSQDPPFTFTSGPGVSFLSRDFLSAGKEILDRLVLSSLAILVNVAHTQKALW